MPFQTAEEINYQNMKMIAAQLRKYKRIQEIEGNFYEFVKEAWGVVEPKKEFVDGWHIKAKCEHLESTVRHSMGEPGEISQLILNEPPRHMKSSVISVMFVAWVWIKHPEKQFLYASYSERLSIRDSVSCRRLIESPWYRKNWGSRFNLVKDQNQKVLFRNDKGGYRLASSVQGTNTGEGGDFIIYDDPNNVKDVTSDVMREGVNDWHDQVMITRLNTPKTGVRIVVQQRCHVDDMTGHLLKQGGWDHLKLPAEFEGEYITTKIGWTDPRTHVGQLLWEEQFGHSDIEALKSTMGAAGAAGQLQQRPSPASGAIFKREWFNYYVPHGFVAEGMPPVRVKMQGGIEDIYKDAVELPVAFEQILHSIDCSFKGESDSDFVAIHVWGRVGANFYFLYRSTKRRDFPATCKAIREISLMYPCPTKLVEDKANGPAVIATLKNEIPGLIAINPEGGKEARANAVSPYVESGNVYLPHPLLEPWVGEFIEEACIFPRVPHDDDTDAMTQAIRRLSDSISQSAVPEFRIMPRVGEPESACHVRTDEEIMAEINPAWRHWISVSPGPVGSALWFAETPTGSLRLYRELYVGGMDAHEAGRAIAKASLPDVQAYLNMISSRATWNIDILLEKMAFKPIEPIGSYAELLEDGVRAYEPDGEFDERLIARAQIQQAKFRCDMVEMQPSAFDRLRELLRFAPPNFREVSYNKKKAMALQDMDYEKYKEYMAAVEGKVYGEYPKIKFAAGCTGVIAAIGAAQREEDLVSDYLQALLIGISAPASPVSAKVGKLVPWNPQVKKIHGRARIRGYVH